MSVNGLKCEGRQCKTIIPMHSGKRLCDACRAKKSRAKRGAVAKAYDFGLQIDEWSRLLSDGTIDHVQAREMVNAVWDRLFELHDQVKRLEAIAEYKAREKEEKKGSRR